MAFLFGLVVGTLCAPISNRLGCKFGIIDRPLGVLAIHDRPVPAVGGIVVTVAAFLGSTMAGSIPSFALMSGVSLALLLGLMDDIHPLPPLVRLVGQCAAGLVLVMGDFELSIFGAFAELGIVVLVLSSANGVNVIDGQDGLAGGLAFISALGLLGVLGWNASDPTWTIMLAFLGGLLVFLFWNRPPAKMFLGDGGTNAIGVLLAAAVSTVVIREGWLGLIAALLCMGPFAVELVLTVFRRLKAGRPLMTGDRQHSYDLLAKRVGRNYSTLMLFGLGILCAFAAISL